MKPKKIDINHLELQDFKEIKELAKNKEMASYFYTDLMAIRDAELQNRYIEDSLDEKTHLGYFFSCSGQKHNNPECQLWNLKRKYFFNLEFMQFKNYQPGDVRFDQSLFTKRYSEYLGNDSKIAIEKYQGLCQAYCSFFAIAHPNWQKIIFKLLEMHSFQNNMSKIFYWQDCVKFKSIKGDEKFLSIIFNFIEKISHKGHVIKLMSYKEYFNGLIFNEFPDSFITGEEQKQLLIKGFKVNIPLFVNILERMDNDQKVQISLVLEPKLKNGFSIFGHAILLQKMDDKYCLFDPNNGFFFRDSPGQIAQLINRLILPSFIMFGNVVIGVDPLMGIIKSPSPSLITKFRNFKDEVKLISAPPDMKEWEFFLERETQHKKNFLNTYFETKKSEKTSYLCQAIRDNATLEDIEILLKHGADPNLPDSLHTPIKAAQESKKSDVIELLLKYGANLNLPLSNQKRKKEFLKNLFDQILPDKETKPALHFFHSRSAEDIESIKILLVFFSEYIIHGKGKETVDKLSDPEIQNIFTSLHILWEKKKLSRHFSTNLNKELAELAKDLPELSELKFR